MTVKLTTSIDEINRILHRFWKNNCKASTPRFCPVLSFALTPKGRIAGFLYAHDLNDGYFKEIRLDELFVDKAFRNSGYGTLLVKKVVEYAKSHHITTLLAKVEKTNAHARKLYKKFGFKIDRETMLLELDLSSRSAA